MSIEELLKEPGRQRRLHQPASSVSAFPLHLQSLRATTFNYEKKGYKMSKVYVANHISLDGVIQGPGRADEDTRDGFSRGGWSNAGMNDAVAEALNDRVVQAGGMRLLLGRRSYHDMLAHWNTQDSPFKDGLNIAPKYVVSSDPTTQLPWPNSTLITGKIPQQITDLKREPGADLCVMGSGELVKTLLLHGLIDELMLFVHPLLLGHGMRMFPDHDASLLLKQIHCQPTSTGVNIAHYLVDAVR